MVKPKPTGPAPCHLLTSREVTENKTCSLIISSPVQAMPITFAVKIHRLAVDRIVSQSDDLDLHSRSQLCDSFATCTRPMLSYSIQTWHDGRLTHARFDDIESEAW